MGSVIFDLDVLRSFVAGVDLGSFARASERVGRSQSAISGQLRRLEEQAGRKLFRRQGRGLALTEAGETMLGYARRLLELNEEAAVAVRGAELDGWVRLGLPQDFSELWLPQVLGRFARRHKRVRIEARAERNSDLLDRIDLGRLDLALVWGEADRPRAQRIAELPIGWIGPSGQAMPWQDGEPVPLVAFEPPCRFRSLAVDALDAAGIPWRLAFSSPSLAGLRAAVAAGLGVTPRTGAGLSGDLRLLGPGEGGLPTLPPIALSLLQAEADPPPAVTVLAAILCETLEQGLASLSAPQAGVAADASRRKRPR